MVSYHTQNHIPKIKFTLPSRAVQSRGTAELRQPMSRPLQLTPSSCSAWPAASASHLSRSLSPSPWPSFALSLSLRFCFLDYITALPEV